MGAPIKINKDLLVITPNYTKKWLAEGQPKVSGLPSQVALPPRRQPAEEADISAWKIKHRGRPGGPPSPCGSNIPGQDTIESPAWGGV